MFNLSHKKSWYSRHVCEATTKNQMRRNHLNGNTANLEKEYIVERVLNFCIL